MAYGSNPGNPGPETMDEGMHSGMAHDESMHDDKMAEPMGEGQEGYQSLYIGPDMLPEGMAATMKKGDRLEFEYVSTDKDGDLELKYYDPKSKKDEGEDWETGFRAAMSPASNETPEVPQDNY